MSDARLKDRVAVVAGAAGGIGREIAQRLARDGARLVLLDLNPSALDALARQLPGATALQADLTDEGAVSAAMAQAEQVHGRLDVLVHSVGVTGPSLPVHEYPVAEWHRTLAINLHSAFLCGRAVVPAMLRNGYGRIVNIASIAGKEGNAQQSAYSVAKAGVIALTKSMGKELATTPVRVNAIAPAVIRTPLIDQMTPELLATVLGKIPMGRPGEPEEVAHLAAWLCSPECSFSTGSTFDLSGGRATY
ncbi:SDR family NAD(P)-dependent oxidoreductase [Hydrogenophaga sp.]|uniref:SDR family NAD(P)-dependent oxidoreductase n=1 Tax=Hydrogenophaga sp. TaxID=1904254 RepID=UPI00260EF143|nr:SDR family NAD(P)-dependent oxidoreductase [Hydrogenophaga sp.]MCW5652545.1 SDR family oxidoreductase [Hydrogenophaga sp.]